MYELELIKIQYYVYHCTFLYMGRLRYTGISLRSRSSLETKLGPDTGFLSISVKLFSYNSTLRILSFGHLENYKFKISINGINNNKQCNVIQKIELF